MRRILWQRDYMNDAGPSTFGPTVTFCGPSDKLKDGPVMHVVWRSEIGDDLVFDVPIADVHDALTEVKESAEVWAND